MLFARKTGDFLIASLVCLQKKFVYPFTYNTFFGDFFVVALRISKMAVQVLHSVLWSNKGFNITVLF
jgi:hypothetical protein